MEKKVTLAEVLEQLIDGYTYHGFHSYIGEYVPTDPIEEIVVETLHECENKLAIDYTDLEGVKTTFNAIVDLLEVPMVNDLKNELYKLVIDFNQYIQNNDFAIVIAKKYLETGLDIFNGYFYMGLSLLKSENKDHIEEGLEFARKALELDKSFAKAQSILQLGYFYNGRPEEALKSMDEFLANNPDADWILYFRLNFLLRLGRLPEAFEVMSKLDFHYAMDQLERVYETREEAMKIVEGYLIDYPNDIFVYRVLGEITEDLDKRIECYKKADSLDNIVNFMFTLEKRGNYEDSKLYYELLERFFREKGRVSWNLVKEVIYGKFAEEPQAIMPEILAKFEEDNQNIGCALTLIGKAYELGLGVPQNHEKAFGYYTKAMNLCDDDCRCGVFFHANCLVNGVGTPINIEQAKQEILSIVDLSVEGDRYCMYALFALEGDPRFPKTKAIEYLQLKKDFFACNLLLYKLTKGSSEASSYLAEFLRLLEEESYLLRQAYQRYVDDCDAPYVHFISN